MTQAVQGRPLLDARERVIVALDVSSVAEAEALVARLGESVSFYKIGYQLAFAGGIDFARALAGAGKRVFLDLKLHDIGNTVARGVESVARLGASLLTVHAYPQTMHAAADARRGSDLRLLAVTVLTSYDDADLAAAGYDFTVPELVAERAGQARDIGLDGVVCSGEEAAMLRPLVGPGMLLVTPGIRPSGAAAGDQKRIMTPSAAIAAGADHLVVGRPVTAAPDPKAAAEAIIAEVAEAARA
jgi:orotidine-5'-phosphate decarboxylase